MTDTYLFYVLPQLSQGGGGGGSGGGGGGHANSKQADKRPMRASLFMLVAGAVVAAGAVAAVASRKVSHDT